MVIWSGLGILVVLIAGGCVAGTNALGWPDSVGMFVAAILVTVLGLYLKKQPGRTMIDKATGKEVVIGRKHTLFFIPVIYWGPIYAVAAIYYLFAK